MRRRHSSCASQFVPFMTRLGRLSDKPQSNLEGLDVTPFAHTVQSLCDAGKWLVYNPHVDWAGVLRRGVGAQAEPVFRTPPEHIAFTLDHITTRVPGSVSHADALIRESGGHCPTCGHSDRISSVTMWRHVSLQVGVEHQRGLSRSSASRPSPSG